jgi:hypothetical protein
MNEEQLEDALHNWPLEEVPAGFSAGVMKRIAPRQVSTGRVKLDGLRFHLTWMDFALGIFFSMLPVLGFVTLISLPQRFILNLKYQLLLLQFPAFEPVLLAFGGTTLMLFLLIILLGLHSIFPRQMSLF